MPAAMLAAGGGTLMKRVAHLLSGTPVRPDWRMPAALLLVLCSGALLALQVAPPAQLLTNFRFDASSSGELTPGNHREYTASYLGQPQRRYRISMDAEGHVDERYAEGGQPRPIDAGVRQWLGALQRAMASEPAPPAAPATPVQSPPRLPSPADFGSDEARALVGGLLVDGRLAAALGQPIRYDRQSFKGSIHTWGSRDFHLWGIDDPVGGKARFTMVFLGPKGRVSLSYEGRTTRGGAWKADRLDLSPLPG